MCWRTMGCWLAVCLSLLLPCSNTRAQIFTLLHTFTNSPDAANGQGLTLVGNTLYGLTEFGGNGNLGFLGASTGGTFYKINTDGTGYTVLYSFTGGTNGRNPTDNLILVSNIFYGTTYNGGDDGYGLANDTGTIFSINPNGTGYTTLQPLTAFINGAYVGGYNPYDSLVASENRLYGTTFAGGPSAANSRGYYQSGGVFAMNLDGTGYTNLHDFSMYPINSSEYYTNSDGAQPHAGLVLSGDTLYGAATIGGIYGGGTIFSINTNGTDFTTVYNFTAGSGENYSGTNYDGMEPMGTLVVSGNCLFGTAQFGGSMGVGTIFKVNMDGTGFTTLHNFTDGTDGGYPQAAMILVGNTLYGTTVQHGGVNQGYGSIFAINTDGTGYTVLYSFYSSNPDNGGSLEAGVVLSGDTLYGTTSGLGADFDGTLFSLTLQPTLGMTMTSNQVVLSWPTWAPNFNLEATTNLASPVWSVVSPGPVAVNGTNIVTNTVSGTQMFYRLSQ